jgi:hypothetical protein
MNDLKPCPFCGREVNITYNSREKSFFVWHRTCPCYIEEPIGIPLHENIQSLADAREEWNHRA